MPLRFHLNVKNLLLHFSRNINWFSSFRYKNIYTREFMTSEMFRQHFSIQKSAANKCSEVESIFSSTIENWWNTSHNRYHCMYRDCKSNITKTRQKPRIDGIGISNFCVICLECEHGCCFVSRNINPILVLSGEELFFFDWLLAWVEGVTR